MRKILALVLLAALAGCGGSPQAAQPTAPLATRENASEGPTVTPEPTTPAEPTEAPTPTAAPTRAAASGKGAAQATTVSTGERTATYEVDGSASKAFVTYTNESGAIEQDEVSVPWSKKFSVSSGQFLSVSAQNRSNGGRGTISCRIVVNKSEIQTAESDAQYGIATCSGLVP